MHWLALDIGGANLKIADGQGFVAFHTFLLWLEPKKLASELRTLIAGAPMADRLAVTMTGELADCFDSKAEGVRFILDAVQQAADGRHARIYLCNGKLVAPAAAQRTPALAAASNWHALATFCGRFAKEGPALVMDIGSTTTDIIPLRDGVVATDHRSDTHRLLHGELVYTGVERSPVCGLVAWVPYRGQRCPVMQELFATTLDVYLLLGDLPERTTNLHTADRRPATRSAARNRISRMIGGPEQHFHHRDAVLMAQHIMKAQIDRIANGVRKVVARLGETPHHVIVSGQGEFLARRVLEKLALPAKVISLTQELGPNISRAAPAHALAVLAREAVGG